MTAPVRVFVAADGNEFMSDIAAWIVDAARLADHDVELLTNRLPSADGSINLVVAPHEFFELYEAPTADLQRAAAASICIGTEQPGTAWFDLTLDACRRGIASLDINPHGVAALAAGGVTATHLQLGGVPAMVSTSSRTPTEDRPIDVLFMGGLDDRRGAALADLAPTLHRLQSDLRLFKFDRPVDSTTPGVVFGTDKYDLLTSAKLLINVHRSRESPVAYFEWARMVEAMSNRCVVVTEPSDTSAPLVDGQHFVATPLEQMGTTITRLLADDAARNRIADEAFRIVHNELGLAGSIGPILEQLENDVLPQLKGHVATSEPSAGRWLLGSTKISPPVRLGAFRPYAPFQRAAKRLALDDTDMLRRIEATSCLLRYGTTQRVDRRSTPTYNNRSTPPQVSAIVTLHDYADVVTDTLASLMASTGVDFEVIVVDDHSTDHGRQVVAELFDDHPEVPMLLLGKDANAGLAAARNDAFAAARSDYVFVIDADNQVYPTCLARLAATLDASPDAAAAYSILEDFGTQRNIRSALAWDPARLCAANYIDAQSMWRRSMWEALGGYRDNDRDLYGWEDWDLWLRLAATGGYAVLRAEILGRYRVQDSSMITLTNLATDEAIASMRQRYQNLPWPKAFDQPDAGDH